MSIAVSDALFERRVVALADVWTLWTEVGRSLGRLWHAPTRCTGWDVAAVYAHVAGFPALLARGLPSTDGQATPPTTAAGILRGFNSFNGPAEQMAASVADAAVGRAGAVGDPGELVQPFADDGPRAIATLRAADAETLVPWPAAGTSIRLVEAVRIILMESVVHLLDVLDAVGMSPAVADDALQETAALLAEVADPIAFIEAATGRADHSPLPVIR
ncbi:maleylpyruvate isomerase N-terminal domain-containing protein [Tsukamurella sp. 8F]|uniref:maleylpyruvate isomerase N-terminal domain-containing protein n=1 Tax=unclassified Tsukamurella TaxID=2633480 RepID=UPI0023BA02E4|nr:MULTISPECIES: maleylpyruvate isomerase N-terminal domain-containing protein [unclassified Tsukamurella]MDF0528702.1 maleylpyruvate isomerase N-terminal domain-containing protein [Tsukamurella sp. 8J]MDF0585664.1 maleylpyruvate isomerase N-terminal domain-containing protein [Tsukamurella sp. 8F]